MNPEENQDIICHEVPQILIQAILMFQKQSTLKAYQPFALRLNGAKLQLSSALISQRYIQNLSHSIPLTEVLTVRHSVTYDLGEPQDRREILRSLLGLLRRFDAAVS